MLYHAHIYWRNDEERRRALSLREWLENEGCELGKVWDFAIGPHPLPMYQVIYNSANKDRIESFLTANRETMSILLHECIQDDIRDHTEGARWLGTPQLLNLNAFME